jgi:hypothetical protein
MILTIMATVARHRRLGRSRAALYGQALELLGYNWDYRRGLGLPPDSPLIDLQADDTLLMLRRIAWRMQEVPDELRANAISEAALRSVIEDFFKHEWRFDAPKVGRAASEMLRRLEERNWVLTLRGPGLYGFVHRTFLEYLCALELSERFRAQQLDINALIRNHVTARLGDDSWHEVLRLLVGSLPPPAAEQLLLGILPAEGEITADASRLALAWQGLSEVEPRSIPTLVRICSRLTDVLYVFPHHSGDWDFESVNAITEAFAAIGPVAWPAPHFPSRKWPSATDVMPLHLFVCLCKTIWACPDDAHRYVKTLCGDSNSITRGNAVFILALHFADEARTFQVVRDCAIADADEFCRSSALGALGAWLRPHPETKILLRARAIEDADQHCRGAALTALSKVLGEAKLSVLVSRNLDGLSPGRDPREPITAQDIAKAAERLNETDQSIRTLYQRLAEEVPLIFA